MVTVPAPGGRTPEDEPFVVRASRGRRLAWLALVYATTAGSGAAALAGLDLVPGAFALTLLACLLVTAFLLALPVILLLPSRPLLAVGPDGVWIATGSTLSRPAWLPWTAVDEISLRRRLAPVLAVRSRSVPNRRGACEIALWGVDTSLADIRAALAPYGPGPPPR